MATDTIIQIKDLSFSHDEKMVFDKINLRFCQGKVTAIMGPSGTGKTTLLRLIGGELIPNSGQVLVDGANVSTLSRKKLYQLRRRMGFLFQGGGLFTDLNVFENVAFPLREHSNLPEDMIHDLVLMMLQAVGLRGASNLRIDQLSGGMARRVALARAVVLGPEVMLYDEPFAGQDPIGRGILSKLIKELNDALRLTSVIVSHNVQSTATIADYVYIISQGSVLGEGTPEELFNEKSPYVHQFVHGLPDGPVNFHYPARPFAEEMML